MVAGHIGEKQGGFDWIFNEEINVIEYNIKVD